MTQDTLDHQNTDSPSQPGAPTRGLRGLFSRLEDNFQLCLSTSHFLKSGNWECEHADIFKVEKTRADKGREWYQRSFFNFRKELECGNHDWENLDMFPPEGLVSITLCSDMLQHVPTCSNLSSYHVKYGRLFDCNNFQPIDFLILMSAGNN